MVSGCDIVSLLVNFVLESSSVITQSLEERSSELSNGV